MIKRLENSDLEIAKKIYSVFQSSYKVEAKLLKAVDFPPLKRPIDNFINSKTLFFGYLKNEELSGVVEISHYKDYTHINSLVVEPNFFRQGIASSLIEFVFETFESKLFTVETGLENGPAKELYRKFGFREVMQWDTDHGVRKIKFELRNKNDG
ncbi:N-acetyltransferase [Algoriphagus sp.]|uniref:GNAT family N-acetyltransferase n=1 Tax=Algoriphagus sp. TaxID=1872435 RepID=UPI0025CF535C|nr:N-acetyltransferase [Algoriphagus sp.]